MQFNLVVKYISIEARLFVVAGAVAIILALLTVSIQTIKAALQVHPKVYAMNSRRRNN